jgi:hypothetical protein
MFSAFRFAQTLVTRVVAQTKETLCFIKVKIVVANPLLDTWKHGNGKKEQEKRKKLSVG